MLASSGGAEYVKLWWSFDHPLYALDGIEGGAC